MRWPDGSGLHGVRVWLWGGSPESSKFTTTSSNGRFSLTHGEGAFTLIVYIPDTEAYVGWYSEDSPGGFTTQRERATVFRLDGTFATQIEIRLPVHPLQLAPAMSSDTAAAVPIPDASPTPTATPRPRPTPRPTPTPAPIPLYPEIVFVGDVPASRQAAYRAEMQDVVAYFAERYGVGTPEFAVYMGADLGAVRAVYREIGGANPEALRSGGRVISIRGTPVVFFSGGFLTEGPVNNLLVAHEYFHLVQRELSEHRVISNPLWMVEGSAVYESMVYVYGRDERYNDYRTSATIASANYGGHTREIGSDPHAYPIGFLASEWLTDRAGVSSHISYWTALAESPSWHQALLSAFGMTADGFYRAFDQHREDLLAELPVGRVAGTVTGPNDEAVQGVTVWVGRENTYRIWFTESLRDGTFDLYVLDETYTIRLYARDGLSWRHVGWYGGDDSFTADVGQATVIEVDDGDVIDIQIRLPANPADLPEARIPRVRGTVLGPDGEPAGGIGLWVWGGSADNSKFGGNSSDGTFDLDHQNGTFTLRVYSLEDGVWRHVGWYGEGGFTTNHEQATVIEVDGTDVTGIEIRLPANPADLPTVRAP